MGEVPHHHEAEQAVLGALMLNNDAFPVVSGYLRPEHFHEPVHGRIYKAIAAQIRDGQVANPLTLRPAFEHDESLKEAGGAKYLVRLVGSTPSVIGLKSYGLAVYDSWQRRQALIMAEELAEKAADPAAWPDFREALSLHVSDIEGLTEGPHRTEIGSLGGYAAEALEAAQDAYQNEGRIVGLSTGLKALDGLIGGLQGGQFVVIAGRTSMGKTELACAIAHNVATAGNPVLIVSLEMKGSQIAQRLFARRTGISTDKMRKGDLTDNDFSRLVEARTSLAALPIALDCTERATIEQVRARARRLRQKDRIALLVIDYMQLVRPLRPRENRVLEVTEITRDIKALANELDVPVVGLSQLSRAVESRDDKRPRLSDLRESGSIEQDADIVMFLYREEYYLRQTEPDRTNESEHAAWEERMDKVRHLLDLGVAKNRMGPTGWRRVFYDDSRSLITDLERRGEEEGRAGMDLVGGL
jgi:replicative DNA helicase